jgi:hypothetical protein
MVAGPDVASNKQRKLKPHQYCICMELSSLASELPNFLGQVTVKLCPTRLGQRRLHIELVEFLGREGEPSIKRYLIRNMTIGNRMKFYAT